MRLNYAGVGGDEKSNRSPSSQEGKRQKYQGDIMALSIRARVPEVTALTHTHTPPHTLHTYSALKRTSCVLSLFSQKSKDLAP